MNIASITIEVKTNRLKSVPKYEDPLYFVGVIQKSLGPDQQNLTVLVIWIHYFSYESSFIFIVDVLVRQPTGFVCWFSYDKDLCYR